MRILTVMFGKPDPGLSPLARALVEGIPAFVALKTEGVTVEEITAAFKGWDAAVDTDVIATAVKTLVTEPALEMVGAGDAAQPPIHPDEFSLAVHGISTQLTEINARLDEIVPRDHDSSFIGSPVGEKLQVPPASSHHAEEMYYTVKQAEAYLGGVVKGRTLTALFNQHKLKGFRTSRRGKILIARSSLDSFRQGPPAEVKPQPELPIPKPNRRRSAGEEAGFQFFHLPNEGGQG
jgi:hypothetical protein